MRIRPFRGWRYRGGDQRDLTKVVAPPYDQINAEARDRLLALSSHNIVRVTLPADEPRVDKYGRAREVLDEWIADGLWAADDEPALYPYHQIYTVGGQSVIRRGFVALGEVTDYKEGIVRPHERTHAGPKRDRMQLLEATRADIGLLFMLVSDPGGDLLSATAAHGEPYAEARDLRGEVHRLWRITDPTTIGRVQALMAPRSVIIADGHHRYETAVEYARRHSGVSDKLMAFCTLEAPGLTILANHRLVHGVADFSLDALVQAAAPSFDIEPLADPLGLRPTSRAIGVVTRERALVFRLRDAAFDRLPWPRGTSPAWRQLAVSILHAAVLSPLFGITDQVVDAGRHVDYTADQAEAVSRVRAGRDQAAFLIAPTTPAELKAVVDGGEILPQKSTHFYPKLLDGLVFHRLAA